MDKDNKELNVTSETEEAAVAVEEKKEETVVHVETESTKKKKKTEELEIVDIDIPDDEIWTYQVEGLAPPAIGKPVKNRKMKQIIFVFFIVIAVGLSIYFSVRAVHRDTFEYKELDNGAYMMMSFGNTGYIKEITINNKLEIVYDKNETDVTKNFTLVEDESAPIVELNNFTFNCDNVINVINIGANVEKIPGDAFYSCWELKEINVDENNPYYSSIDGVLYNKDQTEIICRPIKHSNHLREVFGYEEDVQPDAQGYAEFKEKVLTYVVPPTVTKIGELCFNYTDLIDIYLPEGLETIETMSFFRCTSLKNIRTYTDPENVKTGYVSFPDSLTYIGSDAFSYDQELEYVYIPKNVTYIGHHAFWDCAYKDGSEVAGLSEIFLASDEDGFKEKAHTGDQWIPEHDYMLFKKKVPVNYASARAES